MQKLFFLKADERSFTASVARGRFLWLLIAALLLPLAASLSHNTRHSESFDSTFRPADDSSSLR